MGVLKVLLDRNKATLDVRKNSTANRTKTWGIK